VNRLTRLFIRRLGDRVVVSPQNAVVIDDYSAPEPDIALLRPSEDFYATATPQVRDVLLVIEVADTSLARDRLVKLPLYARAGVREVWIVNVPARRIEVYKGPSNDGYRESRMIDDGVLTPEAFPDLELGIEELLG
jgi:Uma2 family endonuclease